VSVACSIARVMVSPTTLPIEPIMKVRSRQHSIAGRPLMKAVPAEHRVLVLAGLDLLGEQPVG
jgi:hypothetical protein